jgi:hypothetical protein
LPAFDEPGADGVVEDVGDRRLEVIVVLDDPRGEALTEQRPPSLVAGVVLPGVVAVQPVERRREHLVRPLDGGVVVRAHQAVGVQRQARAPYRPSKVELEEEVVPVVTEEERLLD